MLFDEILWGTWTKSRL